MIFHAQRRLRSHQRAAKSKDELGRNARRDRSYLHDPAWRLLFTPQYPLRSDNPRPWIHRAIQHIDTNNMRAFWVRVFVPHPNNDVRPWVTATEINIALYSEDNGLLVVVDLVEEMHCREQKLGERGRSISKEKSRSRRTLV